MIEEGERTFPRETGGVILGYWARPFDEVVITEMVGPGPNAQHADRLFLPDSEYQEREIANRYERSGRNHTYLGDWHTHPKSRSCLSRLDRRTLSGIALFPAARNPSPLMIILGGKERWSYQVWRGEYFRWLGFPLIFRIIPMHPRRY